MTRNINGDRKVEITRTKLLDRMRSNRKEHAQIYAEALAGYHAAYRRHLQAVGELFIEVSAYDPASVHGDSKIDSFDWRGPVRQLEELKKPRSYLSAYDEAIQMFEWDEGDIVWLTSDEFRKYVLDKWDWQTQFLLSNSGYSRTARSKYEG